MSLLSPTSLCPSASGRFHEPLATDFDLDTARRHLQKDNSAIMLRKAHDFPDPVVERTRQDPHLVSRGDVIIERHIAGGRELLDPLDEALLQAGRTVSEADQAAVRAWLASSPSPM